MPARPRRTALHGPARTIAALAIALSGWLAALVHAGHNLDDEELADRPIASVNLVGLSRVTEQEIRNNLRIAVGQPFDAKGVRGDVATLYRLGHFDSVTADAELLPDGGVAVTYTFVEQPIIRDIQVVGNRQVSDQELRSTITLYPGGPRDDFLLERAIYKITELYRARGHYLVEVKVDETRLVDTGILIFRITEGPRVRIREIEFVGNTAFTDNELGSQIQTKPWVFIFRKGELNEDLLVDDVATLDRFYKDRGYVDVRVDKRVDISPDQKEAKVVFIVEEGRQFRLRSTTLECVAAGGERVQPRVLSAEQIHALLVIRPGDEFTMNRVQKSIESITGAYESMGYADSQVNSTWVRIGEAPEVDMMLTLREGGPSTAGVVRIQGNELTKDKVIRRLVRIAPGRTLDARELGLAKTRLEETRLFNEVRITLQEPNPDDGGARDVLVEVKERNTGSINFGVGVGTDTGFFGDVSLVQTNFDLADYPRSMQEFFTGRAFRGAGQTFNLSISPGLEVSNYSVSVGDPHLLETDYSGSATLFYRQRAYQDYNEDRVSAILGVGRRFGDVWSAGVRTNVANVELTDFDTSTPLEVYQQRGPSFIDSLGFSLVRQTTDSNTRPSTGTRISGEFLQYGAFGGDYQFPAINASWTTFLTVDEDFFGRKSVLRLDADFGYIFSGNAPVFERYYLGGRSFRGFAFRAISPLSPETMDGTATVNAQGQPNGDPIGGQWKVFIGSQYEVPLVDKFISGVLFVDSGTVTNTPGFSDYRAAVGMGFRLYIPQLGPVPLAFDFAVPVLKEETDQTQVFSFNAELPF